MLAVVIVLVILIAGSLGIARLAWRRAFKAPPRGVTGDFKLPGQEQYAPFEQLNAARIKKLAAMEYEPVSVTSFDGLRLTGRYYHRADAAPVALCFHGWHGSGVRDFCGGAFTMMDMGCNVLLVDQRGMGESEGRTITFGIKERYDCVSWVDYVCRRFGEQTQIYLYGISMGATTVLMASGMDLPSNVRCIVADCPYSSPGAIIKKVCRDMKLPPKMAYPFVVLGAAVFGRFRLDETSAAEQVRRAKVPILLIHGTDDRFVPYEMSEEIAAANPLVSRQLFEGAGHGISFLIDQPRYEGLVRELMHTAAEQEN